MERLKPAQDGVARALILGLLVANTIFQKIAIPGTSGALPLALPIVLGLLGAGFALGRLEIVPGIAIAFAATAGSLILSTGLSHTPTVSLNAVALLIVLLIPYIFALRPGLLRPDYAETLFVRAALILAPLGIAQFFAQFVIGVERAFIVDTALPPDLILGGFNNLNALSYGAEVFKTNGVFLLEASFLNQMLCVAILLELLNRRRLHCLALLGAGVLVTYSGTGLLMLAVVAPAYLIHKRQTGLLLLGIVAAVTFVLVAQLVGLGLFLDRADEFGSTESSAFARFISIFYLLSQFVWTDLSGVLFGHGPGSIRENFTTVSFAAFDPSWGKIMYEYGLLGFVPYFSFVFYCVLRANGSGFLKAALIVQFLFLGGYVATMPVHIEFWMLLVWMTPAHVSLSGAPRHDPVLALRNP